MNFHSQDKNLKLLDFGFLAPNPRLLTPTRDGAIRLLTRYYELKYYTHLSYIAAYICTEVRNFRYTNLLEAECCSSEVHVLCWPYVDERKTRYRKPFWIWGWVRYSNNFVDGEIPGTISDQPFATCTRRNLQEDDVECFKAELWFWPIDECQVCVSFCSIKKWSN